MALTDNLDGGGPGGGPDGRFIVLVEGLGGRPGDDFLANIGDLLRIVFGLVGLGC